VPVSSALHAGTGQLKFLEIKFMKRHFLMCVVLMSAGAAFAADDAAKKAADRYAEDQKLCADDTDAGRRMQCLRDAKEVYNKALAAIDGTAKPAAATAAPAGPCPECGKVTAVNVAENKGKGGPIGMIAGGVVGGLLGHQVGAGRSRDVATVAGAAGGAYAGHKVEEKMTSSKTWSVSVRFDNGDQRVFSFDKDPGFATGDAVKAAGSSSGTTIVRR
jgi:outer membrane lipoprotein SlyB